MAAQHAWAHRERTLETSHWGDWAFWGGTLRQFELTLDYFGIEKINFLAKNPEPPKTDCLDCVQHEMHQKKK